MRICFDCLSIFSDKNRIKIASLLKKKGERVNDLLKKVKIGQPTVSYHLSKLKEKKIVKAKKFGREVFYYFNKKYPCKKCQVFKQLK